MPIYGRNQISSTGAMGFVATEGYNNVADLGRALYESQLNDMAIFEAVCAADVHEMNCVREGTMLESEIHALTEGSIKDFFGAVKERLKKIWEKIKSIFRQATAKLSTWVVRNGKAFVALHRKNLMSMNFSKVDVPNYRKPKTTDISSTFSVVSFTATTVIDAAKNKSDSDGTIAYAKNAMLNRKNESDGTYYETKLNRCFEEAREVPAKELNIQAMMDNLTTGGKLIKDIKKAEKDREKDIHKAMKSISEIEKKLTSEDSEDASAVLKTCREYVAATESVCITVTKAHIKLIRFAMGQDRRALGYLVGHGTKGVVNDSAILEEAAALDDIEALSSEMDSPFEAEITPDVAEIIDATDD